MNEIVGCASLGVPREKHHRFLPNDRTIKGVLFHDGGDCIGYAYVSATVTLGRWRSRKRVGWTRHFGQH